jgi:NAD(P)-dependent dehydrogenase (short-subunit alcohol dehydrogenase family)
MAEHHGRVAVVTGAAGGLGRAVAGRLAIGGAAVACADVSQQAAEATAASIMAAGGSAVGLHVDISSETSLTQLRAQVHEALGPADMLMNIAGILLREQLDTAGADSFRRVVDVNLVGTYLATRTFAADMVDRDWGRVVNIASIAGMTGYPYPAYAASKAGIVNLTRSLLIDFWGTGVTVNAVCPGAMDTPMMDHTARLAMERKTPAGRVVPPAEVAALVDFLASTEAGCVNGASIVVDGGATSVVRYIEG